MVGEGNCAWRFPGHEVILSASATDLNASQRLLNTPARCLDFMQCRTYQCLSMGIRVKQRRLLGYGQGAGQMLGGIDKGVFQEVWGIGGEKRGIGDDF